MWNLKVEFDKLDQASDFINKTRNINKVEYHIDKGRNQIFLNGNNEYSRELVLEALSNAIVINYKTDYFHKSLDINFLPQQHKDALIKALVFFDIESDKLLDEKIEVLTALANGKTPSEITNYYEVLELYPKDDEIWD